MGSCISKCQPKKKIKEDCIYVQDKLIISQNPISSIPPKMTKMPPDDLKKSLSTAPSDSSTTSYSSLPCSTNTSKCSMTSSSSSSASSTCSSSSTITKDRTFSTDFLRSCVKDNPHIISHGRKTADENYQEKPFVSRDGPMPKQGPSLFVSANKIQYYPPNLDPSSLVASPLAKTKQSVQEKAINNIPTPKKRARASSPTLVRQKSFRREHNSNPMPNRTLRSPSPSRRFDNRDSGSYLPTNGANVSKGKHAVDSCPKRESFRASPNRDLTTGRNFSARKKDMLTCRQVSAKIDDHVGAGGVKDRQDMDAVMEDVNNPLIALDCFIFL